MTEKLLPTEVHVDTDEISIPNTKGISPGGTLLQYENEVGQPIVRGQVVVGFVENSKPCYVNFAIQYNIRTNIRTSRDEQAQNVRR